MGVFKKIEFESEKVEEVKEVEKLEVENFGTIRNENLPIKNGFWQKFKAFWTQEIKVELTPKQQKIEDEINEFLHQEITWEKVHNFLFQRR